MGSQCSVQALKLPFVVSGGLASLEFSIFVYSFVLIIFVIFLKIFMPRIDSSYQLSINHFGFRELNNSFEGLFYLIGQEVVKILVFS